MSTSIKRQYTKVHAERLAAIHTKLHGISEVVVYGDIARGHESEHVQLLLVADDEGIFQMFLKHLQEHRALYGGDMSEIESKFVVAQYLCNDLWPQWLEYKKHIDDTNNLDITVVPYNWKDRLDELDTHFALKDLTRTDAYTVA
jgi:predicted nucleotidyltransferase